LRDVEVIRGHTGSTKAEQNGGESFQPCKTRRNKREYRRLCFPIGSLLATHRFQPLPATEYTALLRGDSQATARTTHVGCVMVFEATPPLCLHSRVPTVTILSAHSLVPQSWVANCTDQLLINLGCLLGAEVPPLYSIILVLALACAWPGCHLGCHVAGPARR
jgi:hypothetical protein